MFVTGSRTFAQCSNNTCHASPSHGHGLQRPRLPHRDAAADASWCQGRAVAALAQSKEAKGGRVSGHLGAIVVQVVEGVHLRRVGSKEGLEPQNSAAVEAVLAVDCDHQLDARRAVPLAQREDQLEIVQQAAGADRQVTQRPLRRWHADAGEHSFAKALPHARVVWTEAAAPRISTLTQLREPLRRLAGLAPAMRRTRAFARARA